MLKDLFVYGKRIDSLLENSTDDIDWEQKYAEFAAHLANLQHERHMHLLVTLTVGLGYLLVGLTALFFQSIPALVLCLALMCLFIPYLIHYRKLENTTQSWYRLMDRIAKKCN